MTANPPQLVFGLGTGRCGTQTLAFLLDAQPDSHVQHETREERVAWDGDQRAIDALLEGCRSQPCSGLVGDVSLYLLPYVRYILEREPNARFVCLQRDREQTVNSYMAKTEGQNHWMDHDGTEWTFGPWDACYPKYSATSKREALEMYWDDYYEQARALQSEFPDSVRLFSIEALNEESGQRTILDFLGVPAERQNLQLDLVMNRSSVRRQRFKAEKKPRARGSVTDAKILDQVTAIIKTFDRPRCLDRLIASIKRHYPTLRIEVADDGFHPTPRTDVGYTRLPSDVGLSRGRNLLLEKIETPYFLLLDDDMEFFADTRIERLAEVVAGGDVSLAAGDVFACRWKRRRRLRLRPMVVRETPFYGIIQFEDDRLTLKPGYLSEEDGYYLCDLVSNFFVASVADVRSMGGWDEDLKLNEHWDFFLRFKQAGLRAAYCPDVRIRNWEDRDSMPAGYLAFRERDFTGVACHKHGIRVFRDMAGTTRFYGPPGSV